MRMTDPIPQFTHFVSVLKKRHPKLAYLHVIEPRVSGIEDRTADIHESNDFLPKFGNLGRISVPVVISLAKTRYKLSNRREA
jgi:hypothetical protein